MFWQPFVWAHRGASCECPENTMAAFRRAQQCAADGIELDVHLSRDGIPVVIHDDTLDRTTNACGKVSSFTWEQLQALDAGSWFSSLFSGEPVPALGDVLQEFGGNLRINIEVKDARAGEKVLAVLGDFPLADVVISSFDHGLLQDLHRLAPDKTLAVLFDQGSWRRAVRLADEIGALALHVEVGRVSRPLIAACRAFHLQVHTWTVDDITRARSLLRAGVTGIFTNDPACFPKGLAEENPRTDDKCHKLPSN
jgi:glycerophosphoryl diester phosphodiesterase